MPLKLTKTEHVEHKIPSAYRGAWVVDTQGHTLGGDPHSLTLTETLGIADHEAPALLAQLTHTLGGQDGEVEFPAEFERDTWYSVYMTAMLDPQGSRTGSLLLVRDISQRKRIELDLRKTEEELSRRTLERVRLMQTIEELTELSTRDPMTGLLNRRALAERLTDEIARAKRYAEPLSAVMIDIDHFKRINDTYGHSTGDQVIGHVARLLNSDRRTSDVVARYGGEELVLLLPHTPLEGAAMLAERIRVAVAESPVRALNKQERVTISLGVAAFGPTMSEPSELLDAADRALYQAKREGRNRVCTA